LVPAAVAAAALLAVFVGSRRPPSSPARTPSGNVPPAAAPLPPTDVADSAEDVQDGAGEIQRRGIAAYQAGDHGAAVRFLEEVVRLDLANATTHLYLGLARERLGDVEGAVADLRRALEQHPENLPAREALLSLFSARGDLVGIQDLIAVRPDDVQGHLVKARLHQKQGNLGEAIASFRDAASLSPSESDIRLELGGALNAASRGAEAAEVFRELVAARPQDAEAQRGLGTALVLNGRYQEALLPLEESARLAPTEPRARLNMGIAYEKLNRVEESLREYETFIRLAPSDPMAPKIRELVEKARAALADKATSPRGDRS
jgi:Flp pilus assembly protein TadD